MGTDATGYASGMTEHRIVNLKEIEDRGAQLGLAPNFEVRLARNPLALERAGLSYQRLAPGYRVPFGHKHQHQDEVYLVVSGSARAKLDDEIVELKEWDAMRVPPHTMRGVEAGPQGVELIVIGVADSADPAGTMDDHEAIPGWWTD